MKALLLYPEFPPSYWSYEGLLKLVGKKTLLPPLSLITVAAILPQDWDFRLVDCNARDVEEDDWQWADIVLVSGMIVQRLAMLALIREAKRREKSVVVGGPYFTSVPKDALDAGADFLVLDEGEVTIPHFIAALDRGETSGIFKADEEKADMTLSPVPRYDLLNLSDYSEMGVQFSRGCPFLCEFCDIIILYGRKPRTKTPEQITTELQALYDLGWRGSVFLVDDNFIGNKPKVKPLLLEIGAWQRERDYPFYMTTEASVNLAEDPELLALMREAYFGVVFLGIETPDEDSLALTKKTQNLRMSLLEQVEIINRAGMRVMGGFILGFDGEKPGAGQRIIDFVEASGIPHAMVGMLQALPTTHLMDRLENEGRVIPERDHADINQGSLTNFIPTRPLRQLAEEHIDCNYRLYEPEAFLSRTYRHCLRLGNRPKRKKFKRPTWPEVRVLGIILWRHGVQRSSRWLFWRSVFSLAKHNPEAVRPFIVCCAHFEHFYVYRHQIKKDIEAQLALLTDQELDRFSNFSVSSQSTKKPKKKTASKVKVKFTEAPGV